LYGPGRVRTDSDVGLALGWLPFEHEDVAPNAAELAGAFAYPDDTKAAALVKCHVCGLLGRSLFG
jgi:hypothetical protein